MMTMVCVQEDEKEADREKEKRREEERERVREWERARDRDRDRSSRTSSRGKDVDVVEVRRSDEQRATSGVDLTAGCHAMSTLANSEVVSRTGGREGPATTTTAVVPRHAETPTPGITRLQTPTTEAADTTPTMIDTVDRVTAVTSRLHLTTAVVTTWRSVVVVALVAVAVVVVLVVVTAAATQ